MTESKFELKETYLSKFRFPYYWETSLFFILIIVVFSNIYWGHIGELGLPLAGSYHEVFVEKQYWKAWTTTLIHADMDHILSNCSMLLFWGALSTGHYGPYFYPLISFLINGLITLFVISFHEAHTIVLGASGLVYFLGGHWITLYIFIDKKISLPKRIFKGIGVGLVLFSPSSMAQNVSYLSHYLGLLGGIIFGFGHYYSRNKSFQAKERWIEVFEDDTQDEDDLNKSNLYH